MEGVMNSFLDALDKLALERDSVRKRARFVAIITREMTKAGAAEPIIVGGEALEIYTQGSYTSGDIDLKASELLCRLLEQAGFRSNGSGNFYHAGLDIYVDWLGPNFDIPGQEEVRERALTIRLGDDEYVKVISIEDLIVDRLNAAKHANDADSRMWAETLFLVAGNGSIPLDLDYLDRIAHFEDVHDELVRIMKDNSLPTPGAPHEDH